MAFMLGLWGFMSGSYTLVLIAIFVWMGAGQESKDVVVKDTLRDIKVRQAMTLAPQTLKANDTLKKAAELTLSSAQTDFPVLEWGTNNVIGMLGEAELLRGLQKRNSAMSVREVMRNNISAVSSDEPLYLALEKMAKGRVRAAPVVNLEGQLVGLLTTADVNEAYRLFSVGGNYAPATK
jgi:predicted transcriptional regulator